MLRCIHRLPPRTSIHLLAREYLICKVWCFRGLDEDLVNKPKLLCVQIFFIGFYSFIYGHLFRSCPNHAGNTYFPQFASWQKKTKTNGLKTGWSIEGTQPYYGFGRWGRDFQSSSEIPAEACGACTWPNLSVFVQPWMHEWYVWHPIDIATKKS